MGRPADREDGYCDGQGRVIPGGRNLETGFGNAKIMHTGFCSLRPTGVAAQAQESGTEAEDRNFIELFVEITHDDGENEGSLGLTYERKFDQFGTGFIVEFTNADRRETVLALPFFWHPADPWRTVVAIGTEFNDGENSFLTRVGGSYEFEFSGWSLSPEVDY